MNKRFNFLVILLIISLYSCSSDNGSEHSAGSESDLAGKSIVKESQIAVNIDQYLSAIEAIGFSGAIIVSKSDSVVLRKGYGLADRENQRPYTPNSIQSHGSLTKQMTAAAILLLEYRGKLSVEDSISTYFNNLPEDKQHITIHQMLTHTSGLPGGVGSDEEPIQSQAYIDRVMQEPLQFDPGTNYAYSNVGYALLGIIVEHVSGQGYEQFLRDELLLPAGITETGYVLPNWDQDRLAVGYRNGERWGLVYNHGWLEDGPGWHLRANGGLHTTVDDMYLWFKNTLQGQGALSEETVTRWTKGYITESNRESKYGYGWVIYDTEWGPMIAHSGSNRIFSADFVWLPEKDLFFYIQGNTSIIAASRQRESILGAALKSDFLMPPLVEPMDEASSPPTQQREGIYHLDGGKLELKADHTRLVAKLWGQSALNLMLNHTEEEKTHFAELNRRTRNAMDKLKAGQKDALKDLMRQEEDPIAPTGAMLKRINQIGNLDSLHVIGTFANTHGSRFADYGPWTTFVYAEFANWNQYWNIVWNSDSTFEGDYSGPWPTFILVPTADDQYKAIRQGPPWDTIELQFEDKCLMSSDLNACKEA